MPQQILKLVLNISDQVVNNNRYADDRTLLSISKTELHDLMGRELWFNIDKAMSLSFWRNTFMSSYISIKGGSEEVVQKGLALGKTNSHRSTERSTLLYGSEQG